MTKNNRYLFPVAMVIGIGFLGSLSLPGSVMASGESLEISLICDGSGEVSDTETSYNSNYDRKDHDTKTSTSQTIVKRPFSGTAQVDISGSLARVKLPKAMLPPISAGDDGWFTVRDLQVSDQEIAGKIHINFLNKPKVEIDRRSGVISIASGLNSFEGRCELLEEGEDGRKF
jgi:hypothetical protein